MHALLAGATAAAPASFDYGTLLAGLLGGLVVAIVSTWTVRWSERRADLRSLRDRRADRVRTSFQRMLLAAQISADVTAQQNFVYQEETVETRDARLNAGLAKAMEGLNEARIAVQLEPGFGKAIDGHFWDSQIAFRMFQIDISYQEETRKLGRGDLLPYKQIEEKQKKVGETVEILHAAMLAKLEELERPIPGKLWTRRTNDT